MKVRWLGESGHFTLINGKVYEVMAIEEPYYRIIDETGEDYLYLIEDFEIVDADDTPRP